MIYRFFHTFESGRGVGYEIEINVVGKELQISGLNCILSDLLYEEDQHEYEVLVAYLEQEVLQLAQDLIPK